MVFTSGKKALNKKQYYSFGLKNAFYTYCDEGLLEKWFVQARKFVSTNLNKAFVEKYVSIIQKNYFFWQENQRKWFPLISIMVTNIRKKALNESIVFPLDRK